MKSSARASPTSLSSTGKRCAISTQWSPATSATISRRPQLINAGNWKTADNLTLLDVERWSYTANEVAAVNSYVSSLHKGEGAGYSIRQGHQFKNESALKNWQNLPTNIKQPTGHPMMITESLWVPPNKYQAEGPLAVAAYQSLTGVDSFYWFTIGRGFDSDLGKWSSNTPVQFGMFPSAALIFRNHYLDEGKPVVHERRSLANLWNRRSTVLAEQPGFDPNRDAGDLAPEVPAQKGVDPRAFLVGPVKVTYDADPAETEIADLAPYIDNAKGMVRSNTNQVALDTKNGVLFVNAPKAQAAAGFLGSVPPVELADVRITSENEYAAVTIASLDGVDLKTSAHILVQAATTFRPYGFKSEPSTIETDGKKIQGERITDLGSSPLNLEKNQTRIDLANAGISQGWILDANGYAVSGLEIKKSETGISFVFPEDALTVILR